MASLNSLLHVIPLAVAGTLLGLHWSKYWVGVSDDAPSLQFAAKVHELLMQASLVDVLLYVIRSQALNGYLPLGALAGCTGTPTILSLVAGFLLRSCGAKQGFQITKQIYFHIIDIYATIYDWSRGSLICNSDDFTAWYDACAKHHNPISRRLEG